MNKPTLTLMCGLPRSGKSTWIAENKGTAIIVSTDEIRKEMFGHQFHAPANKFVFGIAENFTNLLLKQRKDVIVDATHMSLQLRRDWKNIASGNNAQVKVVWVYSSENPIENFLFSLERNRISPSDCKVPEQSLFNMALYFVPPDESLEGNWFSVEKWHNVHKRELPLNKRIKVKNNDDLYTILSKWRDLWDAEDVGRKNNDF
jgi:predicted kinase